MHPALLWVSDLGLAQEAPNRSEAELEEKTPPRGEKIPPSRSDLLPSLC